MKSMEQEKGLEAQANSLWYKTVEKEALQKLKEDMDKYTEYLTPQGVKETKNKLSIEYDWDFLESQIKRMSANKFKYGKDNWKKQVDIELLKESLFRHVLEVMKGNYQDGKVEDDYIGNGHLIAIALNAMFINYQYLNYRVPLEKTKL